MNLPKNVCLFHQGSIPDCCYILIKGNLSVRYSNIDDDTEPVDLDDLRILKLKVANEYNISHHFKCRNMMSSSLNYDEKEKLCGIHKRRCTDCRFSKCNRSSYSSYEF